MLSAMNTILVHINKMLIFCVLMHKRATISEDQFIPLIPSAACDPKENSTEGKAFQSSWNRWTENRKNPLENSTQHKENQPIDLSQEFPPLCVSR